MATSTPAVDIAWEFCQRNIDSLRSARIFAVGECDSAIRLFDAIAGKRPNRGAAPIHDFLGEPGSGPTWEKHLNEVGDLIAPVAATVEIPGMSDEFRSKVDGVRLPTVSVMRKQRSAHDGAFNLHLLFNQYLTSKLSRSCPNIGLMYKALDAADELVKSHWDTICKDLADVSKFEFDRLKIAVEVESQAAMEYCRQAFTATGQIPVSQHETEPPVGTEQKTGIENGIQTKKEGSESRARQVWVAEAMILRQQNPTMTKKGIAELVGVHPGQLSPARCPEFAALEQMSEREVAAGQVDIDPETKLQDVVVHVTNDKSDRGSLIPGSNYFREYCADCEEPMRVRQDQIGKKTPRCTDCAE